ncbi:hypothetical protein BH11PLA2_BH11PLA2_30230 [soil metagenome]
MKTTIALVLLFSTTVIAADPKSVPFGTLSAIPPKEWVSEKPKYTLRSHQFVLKAEKDGETNAEVIVTPQSKADPGKVFPGWKAQVVPPAEKANEVNSKESKFEAGGATVHILDCKGVWKYKERPFDPKSKEEEKPDWRVVWAIVVVKDEATHVRLQGPEKVVVSYYAGFEKWLKAIK